jgi:hypothetical protein
MDVLTEWMVMKGKVAVVVAVLAGAALVMEARSYFRGAEQEVGNATRWFVDAETKQPFRQKLEMGMQVPVKSPFTKKAVGYPAELCYWTKDGKPRKDPTPVLLNADIGVDGPTFCPDCGRLVVGHNPAPEPAGKAPPTQAEYEQRRLTSR